MQNDALAPVLSCRLKGGPSAISDTVEQVLAMTRLREAFATQPDVLETIGLSLNEVLHSIHEFSGEQTEADDSAVELWLERTLMIICVRFRGKPLPNWLICNWDRAQEPAVLAPPSDVGWGWLLVREVLDSVSHCWRDSEQILFLERRL